MGPMVFYALQVVFRLRDSDSAQAFDQLVKTTLYDITGEVGTVVYNVHTPVGEPLVRVFYELYRSQEDFREHERQPHVQRMLREREQYLAGPPEVRFMHRVMGLP